MTAPITAPIKPSTDDDEDNLDHYYCCDPNRAYCGTDLTTAVYVEERLDPCAVCDAVDAECPLDQHVYTCPNYSAPT